LKTKITKKRDLNYRGENMNEIGNEWRFPGNGYLRDNSLDTGDMETFKKDPLASLARELCQNSIDARKNESEPSYVEMKLFDLDVNLIPGLDRLRAEIQNCIDSNPGNTKDTIRLQEMKELLNQETIDCLRISDFNTTGVTGVSDGRDTNWYSLTKGSGQSSKTNNQGGSKGIGKYASFVASKLQLVFYSTVTTKNGTNEIERGYEGICKLCSANSENSDERTTGEGVFGRNKKNEAVLENLVLDKEFLRTDEQLGADVYVIGFRNEKHWKKRMITKILDSFMVAINRNVLKCNIDGTEISYQTLSDVVYDKQLVKKKEKNEIISQYRLLTDSDVYHETITINPYGSAELFAKEFKKEERDFATKNCEMIRYPYMKITEIPGVSVLSISALCIIEKNDMNKTLRDIENPQHTDWEFNRLDGRDDKENVINLYNNLVTQIQTIISSHFLSSDTHQTDMEGAGEYLPDITDESSDFVSETEKTYDSQSVSHVISNTIVEKNGVLPNLNTEADIPDIGSVEDAGNDAPLPNGNNEGNNGSPHDTDRTGGLDVSGDNDILKRDSLSGIPYRFIVINKLEGRFLIIFVSPYSEKNCELELYSLDDSGSRTLVGINQCKINGKETLIDKNKIVEFGLIENSKYVIEVITNQKRLFSSEVKLYAIR